MEEIEIDGVKQQVSPEFAAKFKEMQAKAATAVEDAKKDMAPVAEVAAAKEDAKAAEAKAADATKTADETQAKLDSALADLAKRNDSADKVEATAKELIKVRSVARAETKMDAADIDKKSVSDLKAAVLEAHKVDIKGKSQDYINARFDSIAEKVTREDADREKTRTAFENRLNVRKDAAIPDSKKKRDEMVERAKNQHKKNPADNATNK